MINLNTKIINLWEVEYERYTVVSLILVRGKSNKVLDVYSSLVSLAIF